MGRTIKNNNWAFMHDLLPFMLASGCWIIKNYFGNFNPRKEHDKYVT